MLKDKLTRQYGFFSSFTLRCIAITTMMIDHIGAVLFPSPSFLFLRFIGRLSFPIFCFLIVEGFYHTRNLKKYLLRLFAFALISEVPYDLALKGSVLNAGKQNVFFTLLTGLAMITLIDRGVPLILKLSENKRKPGELFFKAMATGVCFSIVAVAMGLVMLVRSDYTYYGVLTILIFFVFKKYQVFGLISVMLLNILRSGMQSFAAFSAIPILLYNGKKGASMRWFFYAFYPMHLLILTLIRVLIE